MLAFFLKTTAGRALGLAIAALVALQAYAVQVRWAERARIEARLSAEQLAELERRNAVIDAARKNAERQADAIAAERARADRLIREIDHASRRHDARACLDVDSLRRLGALARPAPARVRPGRADPALPRP